MILLDTSGLLAAIDAAQPRHEAAAATLLDDPGPLVLSPFILAEIDYLLERRVGPVAQRKLLRDVAAGAYRLEPFSEVQVERASEVIERYSDHRIGLADASLVVLSERHGCLELLTLDERHFRVVTGADGRPFHLLPADR